VDAAGHVSLTARQHAAGQDLPAGRALLAFGRCAHTGEVVDIEVRDDGHGIPADLLPRIFDPFFTTKDVGKGSGLGLFIVRANIQRHGGQIEVESAGAGKGTTFHIVLPRCQSDADGEHR
jgi:signal transduction histidine kinase